MIFYIYLQDIKLFECKFNEFVSKYAFEEKLLWYAWYCMIGRGRFPIVQHKPALFVSGQKKEAGWLYPSNQISAVHGKSKPDPLTNGPLCCTIAKRPLPTMWYCNAFMLMRKVEQFIKFKILQYYVKTAQMKKKDQYNLMCIQK